MTNIEKIYKIETHMHTKEVSPCGQVYANEMVLAYHKAGYDTLIITDHLRTDVLDSVQGSYSDKIDHYLKGYKIAKAKGEKLGMTVLMSVELTPAGTLDDYLLYGITEEVLYANPSLCYLSVPKLYEFCCDHDILLVQAHPYRHYVKVAPAKYLHGVEVVNANPNHDSINKQALEFANENNLFKTGGSDTHELIGVASGGMTSKAPITSMQEFIAAIKASTLSIIEYQGN